MNNVTVQNTM